MNNSNWPTHADGRPKKMGEMTNDERTACWKQAAQKVQAEFDNPEIKAQLARVINDGIGRS